MDFHYLSGPVPKHIIVLNRSMKIIEYCNGNVGKPIKMKRSQS